MVTDGRTAFKPKPLRAYVPGSGAALPLVFSFRGPLGKDLPMPPGMLFTREKFGS